MYYNAGPGYGRSALAKHGYAYYAKPWTKEDDANRYGGDADYNALWRTASLALLESMVYRPDHTRDPAPVHPFAAAGTTATVDGAPADADAGAGAFKLAPPPFGIVKGAKVHVDLAAPPSAGDTTGGADGGAAPSDGGDAGAAPTVSVTLAGKPGGAGGSADVALTGASGDGDVSFYVSSRTFGAAQPWTVTVGAPPGATVTGVRVTFAY